MRVRCFSQLLIDRGIGPGTAWYRERQFGPEQTNRACGPGQGLTVRRPGRGLTVFCLWFVFYLMASLVFKNRNPKSVKLAEKASNDRVRETERERER